MRLILCGMTALLLSACASSGGPTVSATPSPKDYTLICDSGWTECEQRANEYCGKGGYREVNKSGMSGITTASHDGDSRTEEIFRRSTGGETRRKRSMTIRCK